MCRRVSKACTADLDKQLLAGPNKVKEDVFMAAEKCSRKLAMVEVNFLPQVARLQLIKDTWQKMVCRASIVGQTGKLITHQMQGQMLWDPTSS